MNESVDSLTSAGIASDRSLLRRFRSGEQDAATEIYVRYARRLQALAARQAGADLASRFDPEDVVQSVFRTFFRRASAGYYEAPAGEELWRLLLVLSLHKVRDLATHHRAQKRDVGRTWSVDANDSPAADREADDRLSVFLDHLEGLGVLDDVTILLTADHGFEGSDPSCTGSWRPALDALGLPYRDEGPGLVYLL